MATMFYPGQRDYIAKLNELADIAVGGGLSADNVTITDAANNFTSTDVEGALAELADDIAAITSPAASSISITDAGAYYTSTNVEGALQEIASDVAAISSPAASSVSITDAGAYYTGTNVEAALQEVGADIASLSAASGAQTNVANTFTKAQTSQLVNRGTVTGTVTIDASASNTQRLVLGGNITLAAPTNPMSGQNLGLHIIQDGTGSRTITWNSVFKWASGTAPTLTATANGRDFIACTYDDISSVWVCSMGVKGAA